MAFRVNIPNFSKGELGPELLARVDVASYSSGARRARNVFIRKYGGLSKRPGTRFVAEVRDASHPVRLMPFQFSIEQAYALEMGQGYMRPAALGGVVLEEQQTITAITKAEHAQITMAYHGYSAGDDVYLSGIAGMTEMNGRTVRVVAVVDPSNFTVDVDTSTFGAFTGDTGGVARTAPPAAPPPPPTVPPVVPDPEPPDVGGGGGPDPDTRPFCVTTDALIRMADGSEKPAADLRVGDMVLTRHEHTLAYGRYPIVAVSFETCDVVEARIDGRQLRATADHRVWLRDRWCRMRELGVPAGRKMVAKITVADAHTYISNGILSHNIKMNQVP